MWTAKWLNALRVISSPQAFTSAIAFNSAMMVLILAGNAPRPWDRRLPVRRDSEAVLLLYRWSAKRKETRSTRESRIGNRNIGYGTSATAQNPGVAIVRVLAGCVRSPPDAAINGEICVTVAFVLGFRKLA